MAIALVIILIITAGVVALKVSDAFHIIFDEMQLNPLSIPT